ncbi:hypothetical protein OGH69_13915 [Flavobacterium sp. MFBS3-15]|uniref:hypothetical protein n=1 Tax=Flavobacterium sp. MFBS3-15 TaxID=2989816 RepID=UPI002236405A|nr:hypothetical protein [Flavobacterium sp. MFBS3-15]MCW4470068.1 hypothetical protein [Flavobacterium sp. MFBS3-15]
MDKFELKIIRQHWIKDDGLDDKADLCSHGTVFVQIGNEILSSENDSFWCTSAAALLLMRTVFNDYAIGDFESQLIPCCGHFMYSNESGDSVVIGGCNCGIDWNVLHKDNAVQLSTLNTNVTVTIDEYKTAIMDFVNDVELFYGNPNEKIVTPDGFTESGFALFWKNWKELKDRLMLSNEYLW